jgi:2-methylcitrate dehydratase PrpD
MALLDELAEFIAHVTFEKLLPETVEHAKLHIFDSLGAVLIGACTEEANVSLHLMKGMVPAIEAPGVPVAGFGFSASLPYAVFLSCMTARLTETDDIDLPSCITPGSVVVPSALSLAAYTGGNGKRLIEGVVAGYEIMTRLGAAVNGPEIIYRGIWPTYLCGAIGVATVGSKILGLTVEEIKNALAISLTLSTGISGKIKGGLTSRWLTLGCAAQNGLIAAFAGENGFSGDVSILDTGFPSLYRLDLRPEVLLKGLGERYQIGRVNLKPYCSARQAIASIEAFRWLLDTHHLDTEAIEDIEVKVPQQYSRMIDRETFPEDRLSSMTSIRYQLALAAFHEEDLFDAQRKTLRDTEKVRTFMKKVHVTPSPVLTALYPSQWPGTVSLKMTGGRYQHEVIAPKGDSEQPMTWEEVEDKIERFTHRFLENTRIKEMKFFVKDLDRMESLDGLLRALSIPGKGTTS